MFLRIMILPRASLTCFFILLPILATYLQCIVEANESVWSSQILRDPQVDIRGSEEAHAIVTDAFGNFYVALQASGPGSNITVPAIYKTDSSGTFLWAKYSKHTRGMVFDIAIDGNTESAYLVAAVTKFTGVGAKRVRKTTSAHVVKFTNVISSNDMEAASKEVVESSFFVSKLDYGVTKLFACTANGRNGDLYLIGATSHSLYSKSKGKGDVIVVRLSSTGEVKASTQIGSALDDIGRAIAISADGTVVTIATRTTTSSQRGSISEIYRLAADDLRIVDGPHQPAKQGRATIFNPRSIAIANPSEKIGPSIVTFVAGSALIRQHQRNDDYVHIYADLPKRTHNVMVSFDGALDKAGIDQFVSVKIGADGNAYCFGYTDYQNPSSRRLHFIVISPTGKQLYREEHSSLDAAASDEKPCGLVLVDGGEDITMVYVGYSTKGISSKAKIGFVTPPSSKISTFQGFGNNVVPTGQPGEKSDDDKGSSVPIVAIGAGIGAGAFVLVALVAGIILFKRSRNLQVDG